MGASFQELPIIEKSIDGAVKNIQIVNNVDIASLDQKITEIVGVLKEIKGTITNTHIFGVDIIVATFWLSVVTFVVLVYYAWQTKRMADIASKDIKYRYRPNVWVGIIPKVDFKPGTLSTTALFINNSAFPVNIKIKFNFKIEGKKFKIASSKFDDVYKGIRVLTILAGNKFKGYFSFVEIGQGFKDIELEIEASAWETGNKKNKIKLPIQKWMYYTNRKVWISI